MRKPILDSEYPTTPVLILIVISSFIILGICINGIFIVRDALATGQTYFFGIIINNTTMVSKSNIPGAYWAVVGFCMVTIVWGIPLAIFNLIGVIINYIKKLARQKRENAR